LNWNVSTDGRNSRVVQSAHRTETNVPLVWYWPLRPGATCWRNAPGFSCPVFWEMRITFRYFSSCTWVWSI